MFKYKIWLIVIWMWAAPVLNRGDSFYYGLLLVSTSDISAIIFGRLVMHVGAGCWWCWYWCLCLCLCNLMYTIASHTCRDYPIMLIHPDFYLPLINTHVAKQYNQREIFEYYSKCFRFHCEHRMSDMCRSDRYIVNFIGVFDDSI